MTAAASLPRRGSTGEWEQQVTCPVHGVYAFEVGAHRGDPGGAGRAHGLLAGAESSAGEVAAGGAAVSGPSGGPLDVRRHWYEVRLLVWRLRQVVFGAQR